MDSRFRGNDKKGLEKAALPISATSYFLFFFLWNQLARPKGMDNRRSVTPFRLGTFPLSFRHSRVGGNPSPQLFVRNAGS